MQLVTQNPESYEAIVDQWNLTTAFKNPECEAIGQNIGLIFAADLSLMGNQTKIKDNISKSLKTSGFVILRENKSLTNGFPGMAIVGKQCVPGEIYYLLRKVENPVGSIVLPVSAKNYLWIGDVQGALKEVEGSDREIILVSQEEENVGTFHSILSSGDNCSRILKIVTIFHFQE